MEKRLLAQDMSTGSCVTELNLDLFDSCLELQYLFCPLCTVQYAALPIELLPQFMPRKVIDLPPHSSVVWRDCNDDPSEGVIVILLHQGSVAHHTPAWRCRKCRPAELTTEDRLMTLCVACSQMVVRKDKRTPNGRCNTRTGQERLSAEGTTRISIVLDAANKSFWPSVFAQWSHFVRTHSNCACTRFVLKLILVIPHMPSRCGVFMLERVEHGRQSWRTCKPYR